jgi:hypothetical protein
MGAFNGVVPATGSDPHGTKKSSKKSDKSKSKKSKGH